MDLSELLAFAIKHGASDLHLSAGLGPLVRVDGDVKRLNVDALDDHAVHTMIYDVMNDRQRKHYEEFLEIDFSFNLPGISRFRVNAFNQNRGPGAVFRAIPSDITSLADLGGPPILGDLALKPEGLILITGPTSSGKSTTLAAMVDHVNENAFAHVLTIEDPIEFVHVPKNCVINQRELGTHTHDFSSALRSALREDPDVILVGEMRDLETIRLALTAAETGHLVMSTLHTSSTAKTVNRIIDVFPAEEKEIIRTMLSESLQAIVSQRLIKRVGGGRVASWEVMIGIPAIRNLIRENKVAQMYSVQQTGQHAHMQTMDQSLMSLVQRQLITPEVAKSNALDKSRF